jgi:predicted DsbA family dithiol-disulfide isomerase
LSDGLTEGEEGRRGQTAPGALTYKVMQKLRIDVWSDIVCPWCAIGKRRLEAALALFPQRDRVEVLWRAFELDPKAPRVREGDHAARIAQKYGFTKDEAEARIRHIFEIAAKEGLDLQLGRSRSGNTFDAHRLLLLAAARGLQDRVKERFFRAYLTEGEAIGEPEVLVRLAADAGLDAEEARSVLTTDRFTSEVREEEAVARTIGIRGVPFFLFDGALAVSGAQPSEVLLRVIEQAWASAAKPSDEPVADGACGADGCPV